MINEKKLLEKLEELKFANEERGYDTAKDVVQEIINLVNEQPQTDKWIPCEERLPEERLQSVIGWDEYRQRCCLVRYDKEWILGNYDSVKITHWQPLPAQPYKKEGAENG